MSLLLLPTSLPSTVTVWVLGTVRGPRNTGNGYGRRSHELYVLVVGKCRQEINEVLVYNESCDGHKEGVGIDSD